MRSLVSAIVPLSTLTVLEASGKEPSSRDTEASIALRFKSRNQNDSWAWGTQRSRGRQRGMEGEGGRQRGQVEGEGTGSGPGEILGTTGIRSPQQPQSLGTSLSDTKDIAGAHVGLVASCDDFRAGSHLAQRCVLGDNLFDVLGHTGSRCRTDLALCRVRNGASCKLHSCPIHSGPACGQLTPPRGTQLCRGESWAGAPYHSHGTPSLAVWTGGPCGFPQSPCGSSTCD